MLDNVLQRCEAELFEVLAQSHAGDRKIGPCGRDDYRCDIRTVVAIVKDIRVGHISNV